MTSILSARAVNLLLEQEHGGRREVKEKQEKRQEKVGEDEPIPLLHTPLVIRKCVLMLNQSLSPGNFPNPVLQNKSAFSSYFSSLDI